MEIKQQVPTLVGGVLADQLPLPPIQAALYEYVLAGNGLFVRGKRTDLQAMVPIHGILPEEMTSPFQRAMFALHRSLVRSGLCRHRLYELPNCRVEAMPKHVLAEMRQRARMDVFTGQLFYTGLLDVKPYVHPDVPRVPAWMVSEMLLCARHARDDAGRPLEILFHLNCDAGWRLEQPAQAQSGFRVQPTDASFGSSYVRALVEVHSHAGAPAYFSGGSGGDDADETGFRLYAVLGDVYGERPTIRARVGVYGQRWEIPAAWVFELPDQVGDCVAKEWETRDGA